MTRDLIYGPDEDTNPDNDVAPITITTEELPQTGTDAKMIAASGAGAVVLGGLLLLAMQRFGWRREQRMRRLS